MISKIRLRLSFWLIFAVLAIVSFAYLAPTSSVNAAGVNQQMNFQGRLLNAQGAIAPDGHYNVEFKIYQGGTGQAAGNPDGSLVWSESHLNASSNGVVIRNGYLSVQLGSVNPFDSLVDWNQDTLWLSLNIGSTSTSCSTFASCAPDGEMVPMKRLSSSPYAMNSGQLGGLSSDQFLQLAQGIQNDASLNASIGINKTSSGNILVLQSSGQDALTINNTGDIRFGAFSDHRLSIAQVDSGAGKSLTVAAGDAANGSLLEGGDLVLQGGAGDISAESGGVVVKANSTDSTATFNVQNSDSRSLLSVDTVNSRVQIGSSTGSSTDSTLLVLNNYSSATDPAGGTNGAMYYNTSNNIYRCFTDGSWANCAGAGGGLGGSGTAGSIAMFTSGNNLANSILSQSGSTMSVAGGLQTTGNVQVAGTLGVDTINSNSGLALNIGSATTTAINLDQNTMIAANKNLTAGGKATFRSSTNATDAFQIQDSAGSNIFTADTVNKRLMIGQSGNTNGTLLFHNSSGSNTVTLGLKGNPDQSYSLYLPTTHPGTSQCIKSGFSDASQLAFGDCMAPTTPVFVQQITRTTNGASSLTTTLPSISKQGDLIVAVIATNGSTSNVTSVTDTAGNTWQRAANGTTSGSNAEIWYAANTNPATSVTVNVSGSSAISVNVNEYAGVAAVNVLDVAQGQGNGNAKTFSTPSITTTMDHDLVIAAVAYDGSKIVAPTSTGWNTLTTASGTIGVQSSYRDAVTAGANQFGWETSSSITSGTVIAAFKPAGNGADYAEMYGTDDKSIEAGDIVSFDPAREASKNGNKAWIVKTQQANQDALGVVSTHPGMIIGQLFKPWENPQAVALKGRVPVKVNTQNGSIKPGDYITASSIPGVGMKATNAGMVIGQAMSSFDGDGQGTVTIFIKNTYFAGVSPSIKLSTPDNQPIADLPTNTTTTIDGQSLQSTTNPAEDTPADSLNNEPDSRLEPIDPESLNIKPTADVKGATDSIVSKLNIQGSQGQQLFTSSGTNMLLTVGDGRPALASTGRGDLVVSGNLEVRSTLLIGDKDNGFLIKVGQAPSSKFGLFIGNMRPTKTLSLVPEYSGLVSSYPETGKLSTGFDDHNYYQWTSDGDVSQTAKLNVRIPVPRDWSGLPNRPKICYNTWSSQLDQASITTQFIDTQHQPQSKFNTTPTKANEWQYRCSDAIGGTIVVDGQSYLTVKVELTASHHQIIRLGELSIDYLAAF